MAITEVELTWSGESSELSRELDVEAVGATSYVEVYDVIVDDPANDNSTTVMFDSQVKQIGDQLGSNFMWVTSVSPSRISPVMFKLVVTYKSLDFDPTDPEANPLNAPTKVKWKTVKTTGEIDQDINGDPIVTPVGEPVKGITRPFSDLGAVLTKTFETFNPLDFYDFIDFVNTDAFLGFPPGTAKVEDISADPRDFVVSSTTVTYYDVAAFVLFRKPIHASAERAWWNRRPLKGNWVYDDNNNVVPATIGGELAPGPVYLSEAGKQVASDQAIWTEDEILGSTAFSAMGFNV